MTLEPVEGRIDESFAIEFWPPEEVAQLETDAEREGRAIPLEGPEPIVGGVIDVGQLAYEHLAAALDPYPRKAGASFEWQDSPVAQSAESGDKPFAKLSRLIRPKDAPSD